MAFEIEAEPGAEDANAYATLEEAEEYLAFRVGGSAFFDLEEDEKAQALVTAAREIDALEGDPGLLGDRTDADQALAFPRDGDEDLPVAVVRASIELALSYAPAFADDYSGDALNGDVSNGNIKREEVAGAISTEYFERTVPGATSIERLPAVVQRLLAPFVVSTSANAWGSASVVRAS